MAAPKYFALIIITTRNTNAPQHLRITDKYQHVQCVTSQFHSTRTNPWIRLYRNILTVTVTQKQRLENGKRKKKKEGTCCAPKCKVRELIELKCDSCSKRVCLKHRHPNDHNCVFLKN